jgi:iron complex transport system ATP-binding protein
LFGVYLPEVLMLEAHQIGHRYSGKDWLFRDVTLRVRPGEVLAVLGPNARGKTTLLTCLAGIRRPSEGSVTHAGGLGYVPQAQAADHPYTSHEMVVMGRARRIRPWAVPSTADHDAAWNALDRVGMAGRGADPYGSLSGGQRQLVLMARALVHEPRMIVLDEPTSALDLRNQRIVLSVVADLAAHGMGVVLTTHDPTHALHVSDRTLLMDETLRFGPTGDLLTAPELSRLYRTPVRTADVEFETGPRTVVVPDLLTREL